MATTTTNFGWDIPQSTDLVKDGATAIAALGQDIDTAFVDFKGGTTGQVLKKTSNTDLDVEWGTASSGLTLINTTSFSGVSSVTLANDTFSSTYRAYKIIIEVTSGTAQEVLLLRMTSAGTPVTTAVYDRNHTYQAPSTAGTWNDDGSGDNQTSIRMSAYPTAGNIIDFNIYNPFETRFTQVLGLNFSATGGLYLGGARVETTTSYDGLQFFTASGTMTGNYQVYGFNR
jgi:hypothetical protein